MSATPTSVRRSASAADAEGLSEGMIERDRGSALIFALVFIMLGSFIVIPVLRYSASVLHNSSVQRDRISRAEAVRGSLRVALAEGSDLYAACSASGLHQAVTLAAPDLGVPVHTECTTLAEATEQSASDLRISMALVHAGVANPAAAVGNAYSKSGNAHETEWVADTSATGAAGKVYLPYLPSHSLAHPSASGYRMPSWAGSCRVFFPGTYTDAITLTDGVPTFFTSGVYYFENTVTFGAGSKVVVGDGAIEGCTTDAEAAFYAVNAPTTVNISGIGGTFVFGAAGRLVVTDGGSSSGASVQFNSRLVDPTDVGNAVSQGVSIESVNGVAATSTTSNDYTAPGKVFVPKSLTETNPNDTVAAVDAASTAYHPSTIVPNTSPPTDSTAIITVSFTGSGAATFYVPGYVSVPQGIVSVAIGAGKGAGKSVQLVGGLLGAAFGQTTDSSVAAGAVQVGMVNRVVQRTFKIVATTASGAPRVTSTAVVQVNDFGEFAINSWSTTS